MSELKVIPTRDEFVATFEAARHKIGCMDLCLDATIDDYPIGRRERGKCRLQVERASGKGYRTVRTTTNKRGSWCMPKKSTYTNEVIVVVRGLDDEHQHAWLHVGNPHARYGGTGVSIQFANGAWSSLIKCWRSDPPRREDYHYTSVIRWSHLSMTRGGLLPENMTEKREDHCLTADSPEEIAAWDVWVEELKIVREMLLSVWNRSVQAAAS
jgi:hypothetical protein